MSGELGTGGGAGTVRWRAQYSTEELAPTQTPCLLLVRGSDGVHALNAGSDQLRLLPARGQDGGSAREALAEGGHVVFLEGKALRDDPTLEYLDRKYSTGIYRLDLRTHATTRMPFEPRPGRMTGRGLAAAYDGRRLLISEAWSLPFEIPADVTAGDLRRLRRDARRTTLTLVDVASLQLQEVGTFGEGIGGGGSDEDPGIQWSPDGRLVAMNVPAPIVPGQVATPGGVQVVDADSWVVLQVIPKAHLIGSLAWSPDCTRLLIDKFGQVAVHDLTTGVTSPVPAFPDERPEPPGHGKPRVLGFADQEHVFTATERGKVMTIWSTHTQTGDTEPLCRCSGRQGQYPTLAPLPVSAWQ